MRTMTRSWRRFAMGSKACVCLLLANGALAAPTIQGASGTFEHKAQVTIVGSGFGTKPQAAPLVWDDASGTSILDKWDGFWPNKAIQFDTQYRAIQRNISPPHNRVNKYVAGAHGRNAGFDDGFNVIVWKNIESPKFIYASWYQRSDDQWVFGGDNNYKTFAYSVCCSPYELPNNWYLNYAPPKPGSRTSDAQHMLNDDGASLVFPDVNGKSRFWAQAVNPFAGQWSKLEAALFVSSDSDGYIKFWENGKLVVDYKGSTDRYAGTRRTVGIGGFARNTAQPNNWRYFADLYLDTTLSRVVIANNQLLSRATLIENQIPTAWSDSSITVTINLGKFTAGQTAFVFVVDSTGAVNLSGLPMVVGGTANVKIPNPPSDFRAAQ